MPDQTKEYTVIITDVDRIQIRQRRDGHNILSFSVQYEALINKRWRKITRYDSSDGGPHFHIFHADKKEYRHIMSETDNNRAFTEAQHFIKRNFQRMRENYIIIGKLNRVQ